MLDAAKRRALLFLGTQTILRLPGGSSFFSAKQLKRNLCHPAHLQKEDSVKELLAALLLAMFAAIAPAVQNATAQETKAEKAPSNKEIRWHGAIIRIDKEKSFLDVRKGNAERRIHYDSSTKWTKGKEVIESSGVKEGDDVITLSKENEKKELVATRIDLRPPK
jgi:hypothetical protein